MFFSLGYDEEKTVEKEKKGSFSQDSLGLAVGGTQNERRGEAEEKASSGSSRLSSSPLQKCSVFPSFTRAASELLGPPGGRLLRGHAHPEGGEILRAAHVRSLVPCSVPGGVQPD